MQFILKKQDIDLLLFDLYKNEYETYSVKIEKLITTKEELLPLKLNLTNQDLLAWITKRNIPKNREFVTEILASLNLEPSDLIGLLLVGKSLSLNDDYWVVEKDFSGLYKDYNLYQNDFNKSVGLIAYTGTGYNNSIGTLAELTTHGTLRKAWRNTKQGIYLYKGALQGYHNAGNEPYCEYFAYQIAKQMELNAIPYDLDKWCGQIASTCKCFCSLEKSFYPVSVYLEKNDGFEQIANVFKSLSSKAYDDFCSMMIFDAIIYNTDRHTNNFGVFRDNQTGAVLGMATLFDHGFSLFDEANELEISTLTELDKYRKKLSPAIGSSFNNNILAFLGATQKKQVLKLVNFKLENHPKYPFDEHRLKIINEYLQKRITEILDLKKDKTKKILEENSTPKERSFTQLNNIEKQCALETLLLDKEFLDPDNKYSNEEFAHFFSFIPYYKDNKLISVETIQNYDIDIDDLSIEGDSL